MPGRFHIGAMNKLPTIVLTVALAIGFFPATCAAQDARERASFRWLCTQEHDEMFHVACAPRSAVLDAAAPCSAVHTVESPVRWDSAFARRPVAERGCAEVFSTEIWRVPLHTQPSDPAMVRTLLASVLCGKTSDCSIHYEESTLNMARR